MVTFTEEILKDFSFCEVWEADEIDLSYRNRFEKVRVLFTQGSLKSHELLGDYIRKAIEKPETAMKE